MNPETFTILVNVVQASIRKRDTNFRRLMRFYCNFNCIEQLVRIIITYLCKKYLPIQKCLWEIVLRKIMPDAQLKCIRNSQLIEYLFFF